MMTIKQKGDNDQTKGGQQSNKRGTIKQKGDDDQTIGR